MGIYVKVITDKDADIYERKLQSIAKHFTILNVSHTIAENGEYSAVVTYTE